MTRTSNRAQRFSVMCAVAAVVALGWSPLQALADDGAIDAVGSTVDGATEQVADTVTAAADPVGAVSGAASGTVEAVATAIPDPVDAVSDAASGTAEAVATTIPDPVDAVSDAASGAVDKVSDAASGAVDKVSDAASGAVDKVSGAASNTVDKLSGAASNTVDKVSGAASGAAGSVSNAVGDTTAAVGSAAGNAVSGALKSAARASETSAATGASLPLFSSQQAAADRRSSGATRRSIHDDLVLLAERGRATAPLGDDGSGSCVTMLGTVCVTTTAGDAPGSWEGSVASVLQKLLALTGSGLLTWIAASCILTVMGALALYETRRRSERSPLRSA